ncbi:hypothetical protein IG197_27705 [Aminobacter sp. SR38]|jgi:hypothetical protein|uniref:hypothetical protein n=1 Tax=Aminobacter sp. SR38 TaxID=2774562 RepID=UPI00178180A8|nr:hypothetical protein [Aminobacter sp. SR38]QOF71480.1 hypothetical protein IG197_27705 [Aminobacter sp. SR38]
MVDLASTIFRDFETDGVPSSGLHKPHKSKIREWGAWLEARQTGAGLLYGFDEATADSDPGAGLFRVNNASAAAATKMFIDDVDASGSNVGDILAGWDDSTSSVRGTLVFRGVDNSSVLHAYNVTGAVVEGAGYRTIDIVHVGGAGDFADGEEYVLAFSRTGDATHPGMTFDGTVPPHDGFFKDTTPATKIIRWQDRMFGGASSVHTGNKSPNPLGGSWLTERGANYFEKNAYFAISTEEENPRIAILGAAWNPPGSAGTTVNGGVFGVSLVEDGFGRAIYAETMMKGTAVNSVGIEVQVGNYTAINFNPNAYSMGGVCGLMLGVVGGNGYVLGDADTPQVDPTLPASCAVDISGGDTAATWQKWRSGIVFRNGALYRHIDGSTGHAKAISMAQGHEISWEASSALRGAVIRSDVTAVSGQDVGVIFANTEVKISGTSERAIASFKDDTSGAGAVNWLQITNARTGVPNSIRAKGADASASIDVSTTGTGVMRFQSHDGAGEHFRVSPASQAVNYASATGGTAGINPRLAAAGSDTNLSLILRGKGTGGARLEDGGSAAKIEVNTTGVGFFGVSPVGRPSLAAATGTATRTAFDTASVTLPQLAERVKAMIDDLRAYGLHA